MYQVVFLPIAKQDMTDIVQYISHELSNPIAAVSLAEKLIEAAERLIEFPYINAIHQTLRPLKHEYRKQIVKNYVFFYWIEEEIKLVTVARVLYARCDYEKLL